MIMNTFMYNWYVFEESKKESLSKKFLVRLPNNVNVYLINGDYLRDHLDVDFIGGGHYYASYEFIPENEIWLEQLKEGDREIDAIAVHEFTERMLMKYLHVDYDDAHKIATYYEGVYRKADKKDPQKLHDVFNIYFDKYFTNDPYYNKDFSEKLEQAISEITTK